MQHKAPSWNGVQLQGPKEETRRWGTWWERQQPDDWSLSAKGGEQVHTTGPSLMEGEGVRLRVAAGRQAGVPPTRLLARTEPRLITVHTAMV